MGQRGIRSQILSYIPRWLSNRPGLNVGYSLLYTVGLMLDMGLEAVVEGVRCWFPGLPLAPPGQAFVDWTSALPYAGRSRGILQGENEPPETFAARLIDWLEDWQNAGSSEVLAKQIQAWLGNSPTVRIVDRSGFWVSIDPSGNVTTATAAWDWDSVSNPERKNFWSDLWIIIYPTEWPITGTDLTSLVGLWGKYGNVVGNGHAVDRVAVSAILQLVAQWKGAHSYVQAIIWSYDATLFVPGSPVSGDPDGTWGYWAKEVAGALLPARTGADDGLVRYWVPPGGG